MKRRFEIFFKESLYLEFKNHLYSFLRRRSEIRRCLKREDPGRIIEIGAGISPISGQPKVIYSDISELSMRFLRQKKSLPFVCVTRVENMAFKDAAASCVICSEVIEHVDEDIQALQEISRIIEPGGRLLLTVPVQRFYYAFDDLYVGHKRRYEIDSLKSELRKLGFGDILIDKVAGPLEKALTLVGVFLFSQLRRKKASEKVGGHTFPALVLLYRVLNLLLSFLVFLDAKIMPMKLSTILLFDCRKDGRLG